MVQVINSLESLTDSMKKIKTLIFFSIIISLCTSTTLRNITWKDGISLWKDVLKKSPQKVRPYVNISDSYIKQDRPLDAINTLQKGLASIQNRRNTEMLYYNMGLAYAQLKKYQDSLYFFNIASSINPANSDTYMNMGVSYINLGNYNQAIEAIKESIRLKSKQLPNAYFNLGTAYLRMNKHTEAIENFKKALEIDPAHALSYEGIGIAFMEIRKYNDSLHYLREAFRLNRSPFILHNIGLVQMSLNEYEQAINSFKEASNMQPNIAEIYLNMGVAYGKLGDHNKAIEAFEKAIQIREDYEDAYYNLSLSYISLNNYSSALNTIRKLQKLNKGLAEELFSLLQNNK